jgi:hypothetical protein
VRGWLHPDFTAVGELVVTHDKIICDSYTWGAKPVR